MFSTFQIIMIIAGLGVVATWAIVCNALYKSAKWKQMTLQQCPIVRDRMNNMLLEAKRLCGVIASASTYDAYCAAEEELNGFADAYRDCEGFQPVAYDLLSLLEKARRLVRMQDKARPIDLRYLPE